MKSAFLRFGIFVLLLIISTLAFSSLLNNQYFSMHDSQHVARLYVLYRAVVEGEWYPRWVGLFGFNYGYPLFNFYPPLIYYVALIFKFIGFSFTASIKAMIFVGFFLGAAGMYKLTEHLTKSRLAALFSSVLFTFFTYHGVLVFVRGAFAEFMAMNLVPYVLLTLNLIRLKPTIQYSLIGAIALALLILAHPLIAFPFVLIYVAYIIYSLVTTKNKGKYLFYGGMSGLVGLGLSAFFWLPSMLERSFTLVNDILLTELANYHVHFVYPDQLWSSGWGYGGSGPGYTDNISFQLGKIHILLVISSLLFGLIFTFIKRHQKDFDQGTYWFYALCMFFSVFMTTEFSLFVWKNISFLGYLQFPWRFLTFAGVFIPIIAAFLIVFLSKLLRIFFKNDTPRSVLIMIFIVLTSSIIISSTGKHFKPQQYLMQSDEELTSFDEITWRVSSTSFEFAPKGEPLKKSEYGTSIFDIEKDEVPTRRFTTDPPNLDVQQTRNAYGHIAFQTKAQSAFFLNIPIFYFPGWQAYVDGVKVPISHNDRYQTMTVAVDKGKHYVTFAFEDTPVRKIGNGVSIVSLAFLFVTYYLVRQKEEDIVSPKA